MPFVTEEIWQDMAPRQRRRERLGRTRCPNAAAAATRRCSNSVELLKEAVSAVRNVRKERNLPDQGSRWSSVRDRGRELSSRNYGALLRKTANLNGRGGPIAEKPVRRRRVPIVKTTQYFVPLGGQHRCGGRAQEAAGTTSPTRKVFWPPFGKSSANERFVQNAPATSGREPSDAKRHDAEAKIKALKGAYRNARAIRLRITNKTAIPRAVAARGIRFYRPKARLISPFVAGSEFGVQTATPLRS